MERKRRPWQDDFTTARECLEPVEFRRGKEGFSPLRPSKEAPSSANTLILNFWPPEL